jgi:hypothetical protein
VDNCLYGNINNKSYELEVEELKNLSKKELYLDCKINSLKTIFKFINCNNILFKICDDISLHLCTFKTPIFLIEKIKNFILKK